MAFPIHSTICKTPNSSHIYLIDKTSAAFPIAMHIDRVWLISRRRRCARASLAGTHGSFLGGSLGDLNLALLRTQINSPSAQVVQLTLQLPQHKTHRSATSLDSLCLHELHAL